MSGRAATQATGSNDSALSHERILWSVGALRVAGVDEVGLGPWAGPVVAAAVVFPRGCRILAGMDDSKKLTATKREQLAVEIGALAAGVSLGIVDVAEVDERGVHQAGLEAMRRAVVGLDPAADHLLVDAREVPGVAIRQSAFVRADAFIYSVSAASIVAKVQRDAIMRDMDEKFPGYGFSRHMGYGTALHLTALRALGPCEIHRRSFAPVRRVLSRNSA